MFLNLSGPPYEVLPAKCDHPQGLVVLLLCSNTSVLTKPYGCGDNWDPHVNAAGLRITLVSNTKDKFNNSFYEDLLLNLQPLLSIKLYCL